MSKLTVFEKPVEDPRIEKTLALKVDRNDAMKGRLRTRSQITNEDIAIDLPRGEMVADGSVFGPSPGGYYYRVEIIPEKVVRVNIATGREDLDSRIKLGYHIGNHHLEVLIEDDSTYIPATIGEDKIKDILRKSELPLKIETEERVLSYQSSNYFAGEDSE